MTVHSRDTQTFTALEPMAAHHGTDCASPPATHQNSSYEGAVYLCRDHVMTAINASGYGLIYLTPPAMADWSAGESIVRWDMSTLRTSPRDWFDVWVMPFDDDLQLALDEWLPDGNGLPRRALHIRMDNGGSDNHNSIWRVELIDNFTNVWDYGGFHPGIEDELAQRGLTTSASRRDTFELHLQQGHVTFTMPQYGVVFADVAVPGLAWTRGVVTFGHHSYNPTKDCSPSGTITCLPDSWHLDSWSINPAVPFSIIRPSRRFVDAANPGPFILDRDTPPGAMVRFAGIGVGLEVSYDGGAWRTAAEQAHSKANQGEIFVSYWLPIPAGTRQVAIRGQNWYAGDWQARDLSVWAGSAQEPSPSATPMPTTTPTPSTPTASSTPTPTTTSTLTATPAPSVPIDTSTPTAANSSTPSGTSTPTMTPLPLSTPAASPTLSATPTAPTPSPTPPPPVATVVCLSAEFRDGLLTCVPQG